MPQGTKVPVFFPRFVVIHLPQTRVSSLLHIPVVPSTLCSRHNNLTKSGQMWSPCPCPRGVLIPGSPHKSALCRGAPRSFDSPASPVTGLLAYLRCHRLWALGISAVCRAPHPSLRGCMALVQVNMGSGSAPPTSKDSPGILAQLPCDLSSRHGPQKTNPAQVKDSFWP